ncbi:hypothetical protein UFOVP777_22 [uncultured Caudovirales phage]|uniref:Uncharacterized protein n=1 Tax=uncultured Caudovirales phage TaxID=2100421 RepID=A0A6J5NT31_9CAUD|nr:hypothetical protein UFOVP777_22 [uncultured Caudovirales phage]
MDTQQLHNYIELVGVIVTVASGLSAVFGWHKADGWLGKLGRAIDVLAINTKHAKNARK